MRWIIPPRRQIIKHRGRKNPIDSSTEMHNSVWPDCGEFLVGRLLKILFGDNFTYKSNPNIGWLFGLFWQHHSFSKNCSGFFWGYFWGYFWKFWLLFTPTLVTLDNGYRASGLSSNDTFTELQDREFKYPDIKQICAEPTRVYQHTFINTRNFRWDTDAYRDNLIHCPIIHIRNKID